MLIDQARPSLPPTKMVKIAISTQNHIRLHAIKILHNKNIADIVDDAINDYLAAHPELWRGRGVE